MKFINYWITRLSHPVRGITRALREDSAVQIEAIGGVVLLSTLHFLFGPFTPTGQLLLIFCFFLVLVTELQNSAFEAALDRLHPEHHKDIGHSKDLAAGAVVTVGIFGLVCLYFVLTGKV